MIIVSQNKDRIINFRNVENIKIRELPANESGYAISVETFTSILDRFAIYDTEKRAKEVLKEIINIYLGCNECCVPTGYGYVRNTVYEMPED